LVDTPSETPPTLEGAEWLRSEGGRHEFVFNAETASIALLLAQVSAQTEARDVETHRAPIDGIIADIYERWQAEHAAQ
jgi:hypothetical protein